MVEIDLYRENRPIFNIDAQGDRKLISLLDTGAEISVYTRTERKFKLDFPNAHYSGLKTIIGGFGGSGVSYAPVYIIDELGLYGVKIYNLPIAVHEMKYTKVAMIISGNTLKHNPFKVDLSDRKLYIEYNNPIHCKYTVSEEDSTICNGVTVFIDKDKE